MGKVSSTSIMVPKNMKKEPSVNTNIEKQAQIDISQEELGNNEIKHEVVHKTNRKARLDKSKLRYQFYDPLGSLPEKFQSEFPDIKKYFYIPYNLIFNCNEDKYKALISKGNSYVYSKYESVTQEPTKDFQAIRDLTNYLSEHNRYAIIYMNDILLTDCHKELVSELVKQSLLKFRISFSSIEIVSLSIDGFEYEGTKSYVNFIPVHAGVETYNFVGYSVDIEK